ncbi:MAG: substrate-binding domain-containing protein, partial [Pirellulales bacterium]
MVGDEMDELAAWLERGGAPAVSLVTEWVVPGVPVVGTDKDAVMRLAADYFLELKYEHFAWIADTVNPADSASRHAVFRKRLLQHGYEPLSHDLSFRPIGSIEEVAKYRAETELAQFLREAPKPLAVFALTDPHARVVCFICEELGLKVPEDVAILGSGNLTAARSQSPLLSSVQTPTDVVGFEAAKLLHRLMQGETPPTEPMLLPPLGIVERESTRGIAKEANPLRRALDFINDHACEGISVADVVRSVSVARRTLEEHFAERIGHSPGQEIQRVRLQRAKKLLTETDLSIVQVAAMIGFNETARLTEFFRKQTGQTPTGYREQQSK